MADDDHVALCLLGESFSVPSEPDVVPRERFGPTELLPTLSGELNEEHTLTSPGLRNCLIILLLT